VIGALLPALDYQKVFYGQIHHDENKTLPDIDGRERISLVPWVAMP